MRVVVFTRASDRQRTAEADQPLIRRRRSIERGGLISRAIGVSMIVPAYATVPMPASAKPWDLPMVVIGIIMAMPLMLTNVLGVVALRKAASPSYPVLSAIIVAADTTAVIGAALSASRDPNAHPWPLFVVPILLAAFRFHLIGALLVWAAGAATSIALYVWSLPLLGFQVEASGATVGVCLHLMVAVMTGLLARAHGKHLAELSEIRAALRQQAWHDPLTGLGNRNLLHEHARTTVSDGDRGSVLLLDLDGFKAVNDTYGHPAGDELLRIVADRLRSHARDGDVVARLGGDEFVVVLPGTDEEQAREIADRLRFALIAPIQLDGNTVNIDASIGVSTTGSQPVDPDQVCTPPVPSAASDANADIDGDLDTLLRAADADMYRVKAHRRAARSAQPAAA